MVPKYARRDARETAHNMGYDDAPIGHAEIVFENVRVPYENILLGEEQGVEIAQGRWAGRMHHCMRLVGAAQRSLELACQREQPNHLWPITQQTPKRREDISKCFSEIEMARLLLLKACHKIDTQGVPASVDMIAQPKRRFHSR